MSSTWKCVTVVAHGLRRVPVAGHGAVMVLAPDVDQLVEAAAELLRHIADVGGEVGGRAVGAEDHPILVVAERRRAEPRRAVLLVDVARVAQALHRAFHPALIVEFRLARPHIETDAQTARLASMPADPSRRPTAQDRGRVGARGRRAAQTSAGTAPASV